MAFLKHLCHSRESEGSFLEKVLGPCSLWISLLPSRFNGHVPTLANVATNRTSTLFTLHPSPCTRLLKLDSNLNTYRFGSNDLPNQNVSNPSLDLLGAVHIAARRERISFESSLYHTLLELEIIPSVSYFTLYPRLLSRTYLRTLNTKTLNSTSFPSSPST